MPDRGRPPRVEIVVALEAAPRCRIRGCETPDQRQRLVDWIAADAALAALVLGARVLEIAGPSLAEEARARRLLDALAFADEPPLDEEPS